MAAFFFWASNSKKKLSKPCTLYPRFLYIPSYLSQNVTQRFNYVRNNLFMYFKKKKARGSLAIGCTSQSVCVYVKSPLPAHLIQLFQFFLYPPKITVNGSCTAAHPLQLMEPWSGDSGGLMRSAVSGEVGLA